MLGTSERFKLLISFGSTQLLFGFRCYHEWAERASPVTEPSRYDMHMEITWASVQRVSLVGATLPHHTTRLSTTLQRLLWCMLAGWVP